MSIIIGNKYKILEQIGSGCFGTIYKGQNVRNSEYVAIKAELIHSEVKLLKNEATIYQYLKGVKGVPSVKWFGKELTHYYMAIQLLGDSLETIKQRKGYFSLALTLKICIHILEILSSIHERGLVHRDIKPDNFLFGVGTDSSTVYLIDFGFCKTYIKSGDRQHIPMKTTKKLIGSPNYASIHSHELMELSRRDDLESLGYMLCYFYFGELDWENDTAVKTDIIKNKKQTFLLNNKKDIPEVIYHYFEYVHSLSFEETPDYSLLISLCKRNHN